MRKALGFGLWGASSADWDFVFSEKEPVRLDGWAAELCLRFSCSSELVLLCERVSLETAARTQMRRGIGRGFS